MLKFEHKSQPLSSPHIFLFRLLRSLFIALLVIISSLGIGMLGYHFYEGMDWVDAFVNAAMILSGMGPVSPLKTVAGKIFAGSYALFSGIVFLISIAIILAPIFHRFMHKFHLEEERRNLQK